MVIVVEARIDVRFLRLDRYVPPKPLWGGDKGHNISRNYLTGKPPL